MVKHLFHFTAKPVVNPFSEQARDLFFFFFFQISKTILNTHLLSVGFDNEIFGVGFTSDSGFSLNYDVNTERSRKV